jgi:hypothetical protein
MQPTTIKKCMLGASEAFSHCIDTRRKSQMQNDRLGEHKDFGIWNAVAVHCHFVELIELIRAVSDSKDNHNVFLEMPMRTFNLDIKETRICPNTSKLSVSIKAGEQFRHSRNM